ncbi:ketosteroid isomerase [marine bacterium AO1-C]|nr:ketosteroid isomerase [marine bacterium AO1-C]
MASTNTETITRFYEAFNKLDYATMNDCYADEVTFNDSAFKNLNGKETRAMWHMLCTRAKEFTLTFSDVQANDQTGSCHWEPKYLFSATGRSVHNIIDAKFKFNEEGKIIQHDDSFNLYRWAKMAFGPMGFILGWTPMMHNKIRKTAMGNLKSFIQKHPEYQ